MLLGNAVDSCSNSREFNYRPFHRRESSLVKLYQYQYYLQCKSRQGLIGSIINSLRKKRIRKEIENHREQLRRTYPYYLIMKFKPTDEVSFEYDVHEAEPRIRYVTLEDGTRLDRILDERKFEYQMIFGSFSSSYSPGEHIVKVIFKNKNQAVEIKLEFSNFILED